MPDDAPTPADVLDHLDALYALARTLTADADAATDLVQTTIRRALNADPPADAPPPRVWFSQLLLDAHATRPLDAPADGAFTDVRAATAESLIDRLLPTAFISRPHTERVLLTLCALNGLTPAEAARLLGADVTSVEQRLEAARMHLWETLKAGATPPERRILQDESSPEAIVAALPAALPDTLSEAPSTLRPAASALLQEEQATRESEAERGTAPTARRSTRRSRRSQRDRSGMGHLARRAGAAIVIITVAGLLAYLLSSVLDQPTAEPATASLIERTVAQSEQAAPLVSTSDPAEAEQYVRDQTGRSLAAPQIDGARLTGVGTVEVAPQVTLPAFFFADTTADATIPTYAFDYAMLDGFGDRIALATEVRRALEDEQAITAQMVDQKQVLLWRRRDDIYMAVAPESIDDLQERIRPSN